MQKRLGSACTDRKYSPTGFRRVHAAAIRQAVVVAIARQDEADGIGTVRRSAGEVVADGLCSLRGDPEGDAVSVRVGCDAPPLQLRRKGSHQIPE